MEETDVWDHFEKCDEGFGEMRAKCRVCDNIYCYATTINNLKQHLTKHDIYLSKKKQVPKRLEITRTNRSIIWDYFERTDVDEKKARCKVCDKSLSYKSTTGNLKIHLKIKHNDVYERMLAKNTSDDSEEVVEYEELEIADEDNSDEDSPKPQGSLWSYFERSGGRARCAVCRASVARGAAARAAHLRDHHPKLLPGGEDSDVQEDDEEHYTEVIYLEDSLPKSEEKIRPKRRRLDYEPKPRRASPPPKDHRKSQEDEELESFGAYITCLLKSLPRDVCSAVQRDIINVIMSAKLAKPDSVIVDGAPLILKSQKGLIVIDSDKDKVQADDVKVQYSMKVSEEVGGDDP